MVVPWCGGGLRLGLRWFEESRVTSSSQALVIFKCGSTKATFFEGDSSEELRRNGGLTP